jgi:hypothetical protein
VPYTAELTTLESVRRGDVEYHGLKITRRLNGGMTASCVIDSHSSEAAEVAIGSRALRVYDVELDALRFHGKLRDPFTRTPGGINVTAGSPYTLLDRRRLQGTFSRSAIDAGQIVSELLTAENARGTTRLRMGAIAASVARDRTYEPGKSVQEIIDQLADVDDGFYFVENPVDDTPGVYAELVILYPASGVDQPDARFEFGWEAGEAIGNLEGFTVAETLPTNGVTATGSGEGEGAKLTSRKEDASSIATYDLLETEIAFSDVSIQATLDAHALEGLQPAPGATFAVEVVAAGGVGGIYVPRLWRDFDVGDTGRVTIHDGATRFDDVPVRMTEATVGVDDRDASERLETLTLEVV